MKYIVNYSLMFCLAVSLANGEGAAAGTATASGVEFPAEKLQRMQAQEAMAQQKQARGSQVLAASDEGGVVGLQTVEGSAPVEVSVKSSLSRASGAVSSATTSESLAYQGKSEAEAAVILRQSSLQQAISAADVSEKSALVRQLRATRVEKSQSADDGSSAVASRKVSAAARGVTSAVAASGESSALSQEAVLASAAGAKSAATAEKARHRAAGDEPWTATLSQ